MPVLAAVVVGAVVRRSRLARLVVAFVVTAAIVASVFGLTARPEAAVATRPQAIAPVPRGVLTTQIRSVHRTDAPVRIAFTAPMDRESVRASLEVEPHAAVRLEWNADATALTVHPLGRWGSGRYYTVTVAPGALAVSGTPLPTPVRAAFVTRPATTAALSASAPVGERTRIDTAFVAEFSAPLDPSTTAGALRISPPVAGAWTSDPDIARGARYVFTPLGALRPDTVYTVELEGWLRDAYGGAVATEPLIVRTPAAPTVVRVRPADRATDVERDADLSVRFSEAMERAPTEAAFAALVGGKPLAGAFRWVEGGTVLVFDPAAALDHEAKVTIRVADTARSAIGVPLGDEVATSFTTVAKPLPPPPPARSAAPRTGGAGSGGGSGGSGGSVGAGTWSAVESYYLRLMNCTRTGGLVTSSGTCSSPGGRNVAPLRLDAGLSSKVARPYARLLATRNACSHFLDGNPGDRLRRAGYSSYIWAENLGCRSGDPYGAVLGSHLYFQAERSWSPQGGHYVNLMNPKYDRVGIGVWVYGGRVRLVVDFYHPR